MGCAGVIIRWRVWPVWRVRIASVLRNVSEAHRTADGLRPDSDCATRTSCLAFLHGLLLHVPGAHADVTFETGPLLLGHTCDPASVMGAGEVASLA